VTDILLLGVLELEKLVGRKTARPVVESECVFVDSELGLLCDGPTRSLNADVELASAPEKCEAIADITVEKDPKKALTGENSVLKPVIVSLSGYQSRVPPLFIGAVWDIPTGRTTDVKCVEGNGELIRAFCCANALQHLGCELLALAEKVRGKVNIQNICVVLELLLEKLTRALFPGVAELLLSVMVKHGRNVGETDLE
jgi:hypothetical protein